jgi:hypothetical protein
METSSPIKQKHEKERRKEEEIKVGNQMIQLQRRQDKLVPI